MTDLLRSPKGKIGVAVAGGLLLVVAAWFLLISPQRSKAADLGAQLSTSRAELTQRRVALATPSASVTVKPSDLYRLTKALPNETDMSGILLDVNRIAGRQRAEVQLDHAVTAGSRHRLSAAAALRRRPGALRQHLAIPRRPALARHRSRGRLDARGRLYSVSAVDISSPDSPARFPIVKAAVTLNAYSFSAPAPATTPDPSTTTDTSSSGTVAAGATP